MTKKSAEPSAKESSAKIDTHMTEQKMSEIIARAPQFAWAGYVGRAQCYAKLGERDRAIADYRAALAAGLPEDARAGVPAALRQLGVDP